MHTAVLPLTPGLMSRRAPDAADDFLRLARRHQQSAFQIIFGLLRDELAAETITHEVFARARRRFSRGDDASTATWIYHATLRFACRYFWKNTTPAIRRQLAVKNCGVPADFDLGEFVRVLALHPGKIDPRDCELISLRHVLGLSLPQIGQLLRMHPYEISNRLAWSRERVKQLGQSASFFQRA
jgi:DNA-directed RNA polymerase specialized sigma24 family protein